MNRYERVNNASRFVSEKTKWKGENPDCRLIVLSVTGVDDGNVELYDESENKYYTFEYSDFVRAVTAEKMLKE